MALQMLITTAGLDALVDAQNGQTEAITITEIGLTASEFAMAPTLLALPGESKRVDSVSGTSAAANIIHMNVQDASTEAYEVRGVGLYLADGTLFAVYSQAELIFAKSDVTTLLFAFDVAFVTDIETAIEFGNATFLFPPATEEVKGAIEIATQEEVDAGEDHARAVTPQTLGILLGAAIASEAGSRQAADSALLDEVTAAIASEAGSRQAADSVLFDEVTAAAILAKLLNVDGPGSGLNADLLDGQHGSYYADIVARLGYTPVRKTGDTMSGPLALPGAPSSSNHAATKSYVDGLVTAASILTKLLSVDGAGSGLDADRLDGYHGSSYLRKVSSTLALNGHMRLADGWIIQWVSVGCSASAGSSFSWPYTFPNAVFAAVPGGRQGLSYSGSYSAYCSNVSINGGTAFGNNGGGSTSTVNIIGIGN